VGYLAKWQLTMDEIDELMTDNPSLRSFMSGYTAEMKCRRLWFDHDDRVSNVTKYDDHDRTKKGDIAFDYRGHTFTVEVKSLQTNSIRLNRGGERIGTFQCDASDRRPVIFDDGTSVDTTCLLVGEFDLLAVSLFGFYEDWTFAWAKNEDLPRVSGIRGASKNYTEKQRAALLATSMPMADPPVGPYRMEPWSLLDELVEERERGTAPAPVLVVEGEGGHDLLIVSEEDIVIGEALRDLKDD
jgi:hypothetical protein